ncbi:type II toxin-antitoxin system ParD family antitoxin [Brevundimonas sp. R86498]|uniref:type II toxin-antitoxin system ParD family antitoxin n=1 Tax=Brevundimonas sp. R86498 TaxID=3093845 RepID=UPI0037C4F83D
MPSSVPHRSRPMATMNISLPDPMKVWVESRTEDGRYANSSDYVRDLIRRDQVRVEKIAHWQRLIDEGRASGISDKTIDQIFDEARAEYERKQSAA